MTSRAALVAPEMAADPVERIYRVVAAACAIIAGTVHALVAPQHLAESWSVGAFFVGACVVQLGLALTLRRPPGPSLLLGAIGFNLGVVALYVASRTVELPFLHGHEHPAHEAEHLPVVGGIGDGTPVYPATNIEPVGVLDLVCLGAELCLVAMLVGMLNGPDRRVVVNVMLGMGLLALGARAAGLLA